MANELVDTRKLNHLTMWIDNDGDLYRQQYQPILKNLMTKRARGVFDREKAVKLWMYLMESGAKKLCKEFPEDYPRPWHVEFNMATRKAAAKEFNDTFMHNAEHGDYDSLLPKKYQPKAVRHASKKIAGGKKRSGGQESPESYILRIKNPSKKAYAQAYLEHVRRGGPEPSRPKNLSYMGAQAVRLTIYDLTKPMSATEGSDTYLERFARPIGGKRRHVRPTSSRLSGLVASINRLVK